MKLLFNKILFLVFAFTVNTLTTLTAQIDYKGVDYRFWNNVSIGRASSTPTAANAYLEVGPANSTKGILIPRGDTAAVIAPSKGLLFVRTANNTMYLHTGNYWKAIGSGGGGGITSLNGITASSQSFTVGTSGTQPAFTSAGSTHTLNIPIAAPSVQRGLITNGAQNIEGYKSFTPPTSGGGGNDVNTVLRVLNTINGNDSKLNIDAQGGIYGTGRLGGAMPTLPQEDLPKFIWLPQKAAFRSGQASGNKWSTANIGDYTVSFGKDNIVSGTYNTVSNGLWNAINGGAFNTISGASDTINSGLYNTIIGDNCRMASGSRNFINGSSNTLLQGNSNWIFGDNNTFPGLQKSFILGSNNTPSYADYSLFFGDGNTSTFPVHRSLISGNGNDISGESNTVFGSSNATDESASYNFIAGSDNDVRAAESAIGNIILGQNNRLRFNCESAFVTGSDNVANNYSIVMGRNNTTYDNFQANISIGENNTNSANNSVTIGNNLVTSSFSETAIGTYNTSYTPSSQFSYDSNDRCFTIGNGEDDNTRSNALVVLKNGNTGISVDTPTEKLDVKGNVQFNGALMPRGESGNEGQFLISNADNQPPSWSYIRQVNEELNCLPGQTLIILEGMPLGDVSVFLNSVLISKSEYSINFNAIELNNAASGGERVNVVYLAMFGNQ